MEFLYLLIPVLMLAAVAGFLAGLLGIGGGLVLVPGLFFIFNHLGYTSDTIMHVAVGTSLATIIATGISSARAHYKKGSVRFDLVKNIGIGIVIGVGLGTYIASVTTGMTLQVIFALALIVFAILMQLNPEKMKLRDDVPQQPWPAFAGIGMGIVSTLMGIGGAALNVPYMTLNGVSIHRAVGSAATMGLLVAVPGALGFLFIGLDDVSGLPPYTFGYVNWLALAVIVPVTVIFAPIGANTAHRFSDKMLRRIFSIFLIIIAVRMTLEVIHAGG